MRVSFNIKKYLNIDFVFIILMFYLLYAPPILGVHSRYFITVFSWCYLFYNNRYFFNCIHMLRLKIVYIILVLFTFWAFFLVAFNNGTRGEVIKYIYWLISIIPASLCICVRTYKTGKDLNYILKLILWAALIQSIFSVYAFIDFGFKTNLISALEEDRAIDMSYYTHGEIDFRLFGYSQSLTFAMPVTQALISVIALYLSINKSSLYLLFVPTIAFSAIINARTSIVVIVVSIIVLLRFESEFIKKNYLRLLMSVFLIFISLVVGSSYLLEMSGRTYGWIKAGAEQLMGFLLENETKTGYFAYVADSERWAIPEGIFFFIGIGERVLGGSSIGVLSDIGYINDLWFGGIIYVFVLYALVFVFFKKALNKAAYLENGKFIKFFCWSYLVLLPVLNVKTYIITLNTFSILFVVVMAYAFMIKNDVVVRG